MPQDVLGCLQVVKLLCVARATQKSLRFQALSTSRALSLNLLGLRFTTSTQTERTSENSRQAKVPNVPPFKARRIVTVEETGIVK